MHGSIRRAAGIGLAIGVATLGGATTAHATSLKVISNDVVFDASGGQNNHVRANKKVGVSPLDGVTRTLVFVSSNVTPSLGVGCAADSPGIYKCDAGGAPHQFRAFLDDANDSSSELAGGTPIAMHVEGQTGTDTLNGGGVGDYLDGGAHNDKIDGLGGSDAMYGRGGDDTMDDDGGGNDLVDAGIGDDQLDGGIGDDTLEGYYGNDVLKGRDGSDTLSGSYDDDQLFGDDELHDPDDDDVDTFYGGGGDDKLFTDDHIKETVVDCGEAAVFGSDSDVAYVDSFDKSFVVNCETVFVY